MTSSTPKLIFIAILSALLNGCTPVSPNFAPVTTNQPPISNNQAPATANHPELAKKSEETKYHLVKKNDTLYSISKLFNLDFRQVAQWNQITPPYKIVLGQKIRLANPDSANNPPHDKPDAKNVIPKTGKIGFAMEPLPEAPQTEIAPTQQTIGTEIAINRTGSQKKSTVFLNNNASFTVPSPYKTNATINTDGNDKNSVEKKSTISIDNKTILKLSFQWPIKGKVLKAFSSTTNKGIDIAGEAGQEVGAAEAGKVVYSGQGLIGYGNLVIIKHNDLYLSAYVNNSQLLVTEGCLVKKGEVIAKMGQTEPNKSSLHFEIRKNGKPVNPLNFLPKKH